MAQLDPFLRAMIERGARALVLEGGAAPSFDFPEGPRPVSRTVLDDQRILTLLGEIAGREALEQLEVHGAVSLPLDTSAAGAVALEASVAAGRVAARIAPAAPAPEKDPHPRAARSGARRSTGRVEVGDGPPPPAAATAEPPAARPPSGSPGVEQRGLAVDHLLRLIVERDASDLHLSTGERPILRLHGEIARLDGEPPFTAESLRAILDPLLPGRLRETWESEHDVDFAHEIPGVARFRCNYFMDRLGPGAVFRAIPSKILTAQDLGLSPSILNLCRLTKGLVLVTGPTGSGKSTTLTALIDHVNKTRKDHVITIEDPIEFVHRNHSCLINQREVGVHTGSFKAALRAALREDPDIVLVGEMRDLETVAIALETAETGHLVFGTLHTSTAVSTVDRIVDQFPGDRQSQVRVMLAEALRGIIAQTLCRRIGGGRVAALEVLLGVPAVSNLIREGKTFQIASIMQTARSQGMILLNDALIDLVERKIISADEAYLRAVEKGGIAQALKTRGFAVTPPSASAA